MWIDRIQNGIAILNAIDPNKPDAYDQVIAAYRSMERIPAFIIDHPFLPIHMFRTRTHSTDNFWTEFSDIGLPPNNVITRFARCNKPGHSVFYCSEDRITSYAELIEYWVKEKKEEFLYVTISKWKIQHALKMLIVTSPLRVDRLSRYDRMHGLAYDHFVSSIDEETRQAFAILYKFLFDRFRRPAKSDLQTYMITTGYCDLIFHNPKDPIDAALYPSVPFEGNGTNLAINETYDFEKNVQLELVSRNMFKRIDSRPEPSFVEVNLITANEIDYTNRKVIW